MSRLGINLLGTFQVTIDGKPARFATEKARALLAYLATEANQPHRREVLGALFWPEQPESVARTNLRQTLHRLRKAVGDIGNPEPQLLVSVYDIQLNPAGDHCFDIAEFDSHLAGYRAHCGRGLPLCTQCRDALKAAAGLYRGEFMAGFSMPGSPDFELWLLVWQERYHRHALEIFGRLGAYYEESEAFSQAAGCAQHLVRLEPWRQSFHRLLMRNLALAGQWNAATSQYARCRQLLVEELGVEPSRKTLKLFELIRDRDEQVLRQESGPSGDVFESGSLISESRPPRRSQSRLPDSNATPEVSNSLFVGREIELARLDVYLSQVLAGRGTVVFIGGESGSGKTSLAAEFIRRSMVANDSLLAAFGGCDARLGLGDAYQPFRESLRQLTGRSRIDACRRPAGDEVARRLSAAYLSIGQALAETGPDLPGTLLPTSDSDLVQHQNSHRQARLVQVALFEQVTSLLRAVARRSPLILVLDDLHWIDSASANLLFHLSRHLENSRILIIGAYRPEQMDWPGRSQGSITGHLLQPIIHELQRIYGRIELDLNQAEGRAFIDALLDSESNRLGSAFRDQLFQRTGGNPLFTVETVRGLQDRGELRKDVHGYWVIGRQLNWDQMPTKVEASIAVRFGRLSKPCRKLLAASSVQGQSFLAEIVAKTQALDVDEVVRWLTDMLGTRHRLVEASGLEWHADQSMSRFRFRHHLFQQYAYGQIDPVSRARLHQATGVALEALYTGFEEEHALELAHHFEAAGMAEKAVKYLNVAGRVAYRLAANESGLAYFDRALDILEALPSGPDRDRHEMSLQLSRTGPLLALHGYGALETRETASRVSCLAEQLDEPDYLFAARILLLSHYSMLAEYEPAMALGVQLFEQAEMEKNPLHLTQAHHFLGHLNFCAGSFEEALEHFDAALASHEPDPDSLLMARFIGRNMWLTSLFRKAWTLWFLGYPDQSSIALEETMSKVEQLGQNHDLAFTLAMGICPILNIRRESDQAEVQARRLLALATKRGLQYFIPFGQIALGAALAKRGRTNEAQDKIREGIGTYRKAGQKTFLTYCLSVLCDSLGADSSEAGSVLDEALALVEETGERFFEGELWRLRGEYQWRSLGKAIEAEACFTQAMVIAERQQAKMLALRAATSLARLLSAQHRHQEAAKLLGEVYGSFTEGFSTLDLRDAQKLLASLHHSEETPCVTAQ